MAAELSLVAGGPSRAAETGPPRRPGQWRLPAPAQPTLSELFGASLDGGWAGFLLAQLGEGKPVLWVQDRLAIRDGGRIHPAGLPGIALVHVEARNGRDALWAMEEGLRCPALSAVIGELSGDPAALDFTATRRLAVAAERCGVPCWLVRLSGSPNLSGARMRWRVASRPSPPHPFDFKAPGSPAWEAELFRARGPAPGRWLVAHEADRWNLLSQAADRALGTIGRRVA